MIKAFSFTQFRHQFPTNEACLEEIKKVRFYNGIYCIKCKKKVSHYKVKNRMTYSCEFCRHQVYPLQGTLFEKSSTPLQLWFYALFLMVQTKARISTKQLQYELGVTYKTAWSMYTRIRTLMEKSNSDMLSGPIVLDNLETKTPKKSNVLTLNFFNAFEFAITQHEPNQDKKFATFKKRLPTEKTKRRD